MWLVSFLKYHLTFYQHFSLCQECIDILNKLHTQCNFRGPKNEIEMTKMILSHSLIEWNPTFTAILSPEVGCVEESESLRFTIY